MISDTALALFRKPYFTKVLLQRIFDALILKKDKI